MPQVTLLSVDGINFPAASTRGMTVAIGWDENGELARACDGTLHDLTVVAHRKRVLTLGCSDVRAPEMPDNWRGHLVDVTVIEHVTGAASFEMEMMVADYTTSRDEFRARTDWSMTLREI